MLKSNSFKLALVGLMVALIAYFWLTAPDVDTDNPIFRGEISAADPVKGAYLFNAGGCANCHADDKGTLGGGQAIESPFGTFYAPNISPDRQHGIGRWDLRSFRLAMIDGVSPLGRHYFPAFPYSAYQGLSDQDLADMWAHIQAQPSVKNNSKPHDLPFPFNVRRNLGGWKLLFMPGKSAFLAARTDVSEPLGRGAYLVNSLMHCGACHSPRNALGGLSSQPGDPGWLSGGKQVNGKPIPNLRNRPEGLGDWSEAELKETLVSGFTPGFEILVEGHMDRVVQNLAKLEEADLNAVVTYLRSLE